jgi:hypothetical protein
MGQEVGYAENGDREVTYWGTMQYLYERHPEMILSLAKANMYDTVAVFQPKREEKK